MVRNESVLLEETREVYFITSLNLFSVAIPQFAVLIIWTKVRSQFVRSNEGLLYEY
jgi:hypothetical protein